MKQELNARSFEGISDGAFDKTVAVFEVLELKYKQLEAFCKAHGITLKEYQILNCCYDGQMIESEIRNNLSLSEGQMDDFVEGLVSKELLQRRRSGVLAATSGGKSTYRRINQMMLDEK